MFELPYELGQGPNLNLLKSNLAPQSLPGYCSLEPNLNPTSPLPQPLLAHTETLIAGAIESDFTTKVDALDCHSEQVQDHALASRPLASPVPCRSVLCRAVPSRPLPLPLPSSALTGLA